MLQDLPNQLDGVGEVVWLITPFTDGADRKDGQGNSFNAVIAGYAKGKGIPLRIIKSTYHRPIVDIEDRALPFTHLEELHNLRREAEEKRKVAIAGSMAPQEPVFEPTLERVITGGSHSPWSWYSRGLEAARAIGRLSIAGTACATCFLVSHQYPSIETALGLEQSK